MDAQQTDASLAIKNLQSAAPRCMNELTGKVAFVLCTVSFKNLSRVSTRCLPGYFIRGADRSEHSRDFRGIKGVALRRL